MPWYRIESTSIARAPFHLAAPTLAAAAAIGARRLYGRTAGLEAVCLTQTSPTAGRFVAMLNVPDGTGRLPLGRPYLVVQVNRHPTPSTRKECRC